MTTATIREIATYVIETGRVLEYEPGIMDAMSLEHEIVFAATEEFGWSDADAEEDAATLTARYVTQGLAQ